MGDDIMFLWPVFRVLTVVWSFLTTNEALFPCPGFVCRPSLGITSQTVPGKCVGVGGISSWSISAFLLVNGVVTGRGRVLFCFTADRGFEQPIL